MVGQEYCQHVRESTVLCEASGEDPVAGVAKEIRCAGNLMVRRHWR